MNESIENTSPQTLDEAVQMLYDRLEPKEVDHIKKSEPHMVHDTVGRYLRNTWSLWEDNALTRDIKQRFGIFGHGDDCSCLLLQALWLKVVGTAPWVLPEHTLEAVAESLKKHWTKAGIDPTTGREIL